MECLKSFFCLACEGEKGWWEGKGVSGGKEGLVPSSRTSGMTIFQTNFSTSCQKYYCIFFVLMVSLLHEPISKEKLLSLFQSGNHEGRFEPLSLSLQKKVDLAMMVFSWENARQLSSSFSKILVTSATLEGNRVIGKVRKTQHQNPEFCHTQGEIFKKPAKKYICIRQGMKLRTPSILW